MTTHPTEPSDAPKQLWLDMSFRPWRVWRFDIGGEELPEYVRADLLTAATDPDFILAAIESVHDMDATLTDYAAAVSRAIRAAMKGPTP